MYQHKLYEIWENISSDVFFNCVCFSITNESNFVIACYRTLVINKDKVPRCIAVMESPRIMTSPTRAELKYFIENYNEPVIFKTFLNWKILGWSLDDWGDKLASLVLQFRKNYFTYSEAPHWESTCEMVKMTMSDFIKFQSSEQKEWLYFDYKYMMEWFRTQEDILNDITWEAFGYPETSGKESTIWIGTKGAHTPCHMDTYGCNLIAQVYGRKQWIIFPPEEDLKPTRVPYEESSVYSKLNFFTPNPKNFKDVKNARVVTLSPGDVLFLPPKWWHYVENLETAISVNIWLPLPDDNKMRVEEAVTQMIVAQFLKGLSLEEQNSIINLNKELLEMTLTDSLNLLKKVKEIYEKEKLLVNNAQEKEEKCKIIYNTLLKQDAIQKVEEYSYSEFELLLKSKQQHYVTHMKTSNERSNQIDMLEKVINSICHPTMLSMITNKILNDS